MDIREIEAFIAVAEELHFGRAALRLHMAQPPLSKRIRRLERELDATLFDRSTRTVRLTSAGEAFLRPAREVLDAIAVAKRAVRASSLGEVGRVSIGFAGASSYDAVPRLARAVGAELPGVELVLRGQLYAGECLRQISVGELDLGFVAASPMPGISMRVVHNERLMAALPDSHPLAAKESVAVEELAGERFVSFPASRGSAVREAVMRLCGDAGFMPTVTQEAPDAYNLLTLVGAGVGVSLVVSSARHIQMDHVVYRPLAGDPPVMPIALAWRTQNESAVLSAVLAVADTALPRPE